MTNNDGRKPPGTALTHPLTFSCSAPWVAPTNPLTHSYTQTLTHSPTHPSAQWPAVSTHSSFRMDPPQNMFSSMFKATCHGNSCGLAISPPTILLRG